MITWPDIHFGPLNLWSMPRMVLDLEDEILYEKIISTNEAKGFQLKLVVSVFRGVQYLQLRKYFLSYEGEYIASREGVSMEYTLQSALTLLDGVMDVLSNEEDRATIMKHFTEKKLNLPEPS